MKKSIVFSLLFVLGFSMVHEFVFSHYDTKHCSVEAFVAELNAPTHYGDICDIHFEYHQVFLLPQNVTIPQNKEIRTTVISSNKIYTYKQNLEFFKPPIA